MYNIGQVRAKLSGKARWALRHLLFRYPPIGLQPERLERWLSVLKGTRDVEGSVMEVGCHFGGTAAFSSRMLQRVGDDRVYVCVDTFSGFAEAAFDMDVSVGTPEAMRYMFADNSLELARWVVSRHGGENVRMVKGDICTVEDRVLPVKISACLLDVDLEEPIYLGLKRIYPRLSAGGTVLVDDCPEQSAWKARLGYSRFVQEIGEKECYADGLGIVVKR